MTDLLKGRLLRLSAADPQELGKAYARWSLDSEYDRLLTSNPARLNSAKAIQRWFEKGCDENTPALFLFAMRTLAEEKLIGDLDLEVTGWPQREAFVGLGIGERELWNNGYGSDAMNIILRFAFMELGLRRVSLTVFEYNPRAIRSYEKAGFRHEGRQRDFLVREGKRWDMLYMGILRDEWKYLNGDGE